VPIHDWTRVDAGLFHAFRFGWITSLSSALNNGVLPSDYFALIEQRIQRPTEHFLDLQLPSRDDAPIGGTCGISVADIPPRTRLVRRPESEANIYARKADRITVRDREGQVVALIEIVCPGNKSGTNPFRSFVQKTSNLIVEGVHVLVIDLFPPIKEDPRGVHEAIWNEIEVDDFDMPADKPLVLAAFEAGLSPVAYVEPIAVGDSLLDMPIFLEEDYYVPAPLEATYQTAWRHFPAALKGLLESSSVNPPGNP
jgi:hypothetical protein